MQDRIEKSVSGRKLAITFDQGLSIDWVETVQWHQMAEPKARKPVPTFCDIVGERVGVLCFEVTVNYSDLAGR